MEATIETLSQQLQALQVRCWMHPPCAACCLPTRPCLVGHEAHRTIQALRKLWVSSLSRGLPGSFFHVLVHICCLQALQSRNAILEGQNVDLESKLVEREGEIERLKAELDRQSDETLLAARAVRDGDAAAAATAAEGSGSGSAGGAAKPPPTGGAAAGRGPGDSGACCGVSSRGGGSDECRVACDVLPRDLSGIDFKSGFSDQVAKLRVFVEEHKLQDVPPSGGWGRSGRVWGR
jgi:hypothetical protein